ncbi:ABC transporter permease [Corynebacterium sp. MSK044]|uniref:ABC transporter permease n=1 Tax=unclassified Corynebacterium TaxID=2624378 RepID=UPI00254FF355|nr:MULTISPECIES: ABC transporter permease [unclassified Corynebacterium]MDK8794974.1 ABC transporter permease [Corynebacterium sp. MSK041]MDK8796942.1 ABC transporter permease [Corynebacterium sp. MSK044]
MLNTIISEWTKLRTTASFWWTSGIAIALSIGWAILMASLDTPDMPAYGGAMVVAGFLSFGMLTLMIQAIMVVTTEYRYKVSATNMTLTPQRWKVALSKLIVYGGYAAALSFLILVLCFVIGDLIAANPIGWTSNDYSRRALWAVPLATFVSVLLVQGVGWIVRQTAGALVAYLGWQFAVEPLIGFLPKVGKDIQAYAPFANLQYFTSNIQNPGPEPGVSAPIELWQSLLLFGVWAVVLYGIGLLLLEKRDV